MWFCRRIMRVPRTEKYSFTPQTERCGLKVIDENTSDIKMWFNSLTMINPGTVNCGFIGE